VPKIPSYHLEDISHNGLNILTHGGCSSIICVLGRFMSF